MTRIWIPCTSREAPSGKIPIDLAEGEALVSQSLQTRVWGRLNARPGVLAITDRRLVFARGRFWTDALMESWKKQKRWILVDRQLSEVTNISREGGTLGVFHLVVTFVDGEACKVMVTEQESSRLTDEINAGLQRAKSG